MQGFSALKRRAKRPTLLSTRQGALEEDKRATTNVQNGLVFFFVFSFKKALILRKSWVKNSEKV